MSKGPGGQYVLPPLKWKQTPNQSPRYGRRIFGVVMHDTEGSYEGSVQWLCNPDADASAHVVLREDGNEATQLVRWGEKAWHAEAANWHFLGVELAGFLDRVGSDEWHTAARIVAFFCKKYGIPPIWNVKHGGAFSPGIVRHKDLGAAGGDHHDPVTSEEKWVWFIYLVKHEVERGGFLATWGRS